jgi:lipoprotein-anchoring transpeptidase ErfK/SrfK
MRWVTSIARTWPVIRIPRTGWAIAREGRGEALLRAALVELSGRDSGPDTSAPWSGERGSTAALADRVPFLITISRRTARLRLYERLRRVKTCPVGVGWVGYETRPGLYRIETKLLDPDWRVPDEPWARELAGKVIRAGAPENQMKARWMGVYPGVGIHGTDRAGRFRIESSAGCIRMRIPDVIDLYDRVPKGTPVFIA